jgi:hypothetical protein
MRAGKSSFGEIRNGALEFVPRDRKANQTVQRTGASRFTQKQINPQRRLAPVADL